MDAKTTRLHDTAKEIDLNNGKMAALKNDVNGLHDKQKDIYNQVVKDVTLLSGQLRSIDERDKAVEGSLRKDNIHANTELSTLRDQQNTEVKHEKDIKHMLERERRRLGVKYGMEAVQENEKHSKVLMDQLQKDAEEIREPSTQIHQRKEINRLEKEMFAVPGPTSDGKLDRVKLPVPIPSDFQDLLPNRLKTSDNIGDAIKAKQVVGVKVPKEEYPISDRDGTRFTKRPVDHDFSDAKYTAPEDTQGPLGPAASTTPPPIPYSSTSTSSSATAPVSPAVPQAAPHY